jgi:hypothetical protein
MAALTTTSLAPMTAATPAPVAVSASDTITEAQCGANGVLARVINGGGSPDTVTITDPNTTVLSSAATNPTYSVPAGASRMIPVPRSALNASGVITIAHSFTTSVTIEAYRW